MSDNTKKLNEFSLKPLLFQALKASLGGFALFVILSGVIAYMSMNHQQIKNNTYVLSIITVALSSLFCGFLSTGRLKIKGIICGAVSSVFMMFLVYAALACISRLNFSDKAVFLIPLIIACSSVGAILSKNKRHRK